MNRQSSWRRIVLLFLCCAATAIASRAQTFNTLFSFQGTDGKTPEGNLVQATDGHLYGAAETGGSSNRGTIFKIDTTRTVTTLHSFAGYPTEGAYPEGAMVEGIDGELYGVTNGGGTSSSCTDGCGTVFKISLAGVLTTLHSFDGEDGEGPIGGLVQASDGNLYGTTEYGGSDGDGTVFKISPGGTLITVHSFDGDDGDGPIAGLVQASDGSFYGTTFSGGTIYDCKQNPCGTVFRITAAGAFSTVHNFDYTDGEGPSGALVQAANGNLYGTTSEGGANDSCAYGCGTVFEISSGDTLTTLHSFAGYPTEGASPRGALVQATDGNFYGTTYNGGANDLDRYGVLFAAGCGTIYKIATAGTLTNLHSFCEETDCADGQNPNSLMQGTNGTFYGTAGGGMHGNDGTIFSLGVGLEPFVETQPASGMVGTKVVILGTNLQGATSVTFNGTPATFTVNPDGSAIDTTVPSGATTGEVQVVTPTGTLSSNTKFRVT